ncbi:MAG: glycoside hydrolase family 10, partial [Clostridia bacterium]|nr:glycoside hydrolase family 10 [Clostridia bacterium]
MSRSEDALRYFRENRTYTEEQVKIGIETYRKGTATLFFRDEEGNPVRGVKIKGNLKNHEFKAGANMFMLDEFETPEKNQIYREKFAETFNLATLPFYWNAQEPEKGVTRYHKDSAPLYRRLNADHCLAYCRENGITPKGHCL